MSEIEIYKQKFKTYQNYIWVGLISLVALAFLPTLGSEGDLIFNFPSTAAGWFVYIFNKLIGAGVNMLILKCFLDQGKFYATFTDEYKQAQEILGRIKNVEFVPKSPEYQIRKIYATKGIVIFITSVLAAMAITNAVLKFDWLSLISYAITIIMGIVMGYLQMKRSLEIWSTSYLIYAQYIEKKKSKELIEDLREQ